MQAHQERKLGMAVHAHGLRHRRVSVRKKTELMPGFSSFHIAYSLLSVRMQIAGHLSRHDHTFHIGTNGAATAIRNAKDTSVQKAKKTA